MTLKFLWEVMCGILQNKESEQGHSCLESERGAWMRYNVIHCHSITPFTHGFQCSVTVTSQLSSAKQISIIISILQIRKMKAKQQGGLPANSNQRWSNTMRPVFRLLNRSLIVSDFRDTPTPDKCQAPLHLHQHLRENKTTMICFWTTTP